MEKGGVIYLIIDGTNDGEYVGQTTRSVEIRFKEHLNADSYIGNVIKAHDENNFTTAILKECANQDELNYWERWFIKWRDTMHPNGYNLTEGGEGGIPSEKARKNMSKAHTGVKKSPETCAKLSVAFSGEKNPRYGKKNTPEHQAKIVASCRGKKRSAEACENIAASLRGKPFTAERCMNIAIAQREESPFPNLLAELDKRQLTYTAFEQLSGIAHFSEKIRGKRKFTAKDKTKLEELLGLSAEYLLQCENATAPARARREDSPYKNLLKELDAHEMTFEHLAELLGLSRRTVSDKIHSKARFTDAEKAKLAEVFQKPIEYLLATDAPLQLPKPRSGGSPYKNLLKELAARNLPYYGLAELLGISQGRISRKILDEVDFTDAEKEKLAEILQKPIEYLLAREDYVETSFRHGYSPYKNLIAEMKVLGLTYATLSKLLNLSKSRMARKIHGNVDFTDEDKAKLVEVFQKPIEYLLAREDG